VGSASFLCLRGGESGVNVFGEGVAGNDAEVFAVDKGVDDHFFSAFVDDDEGFIAAGRSDGHEAEVILAVKPWRRRRGGWGGEEDGAEDDGRERESRDKRFGIHFIRISRDKGQVSGQGTQVT